MNNPEVIQFIKANIGRHKHFALGTVDEEGKPWVVCAALAYDDQFNVIWQSAKDAEHSKHLRASPDVAICIFSDDEEVGNFGIYMKARAREVADHDELNRLLSLRYAHVGKPVPEISQFLGDSPNRLYYAEVTEAWINDDSHVKKQVDLSQLRQI